MSEGPQEKALSLEDYAAFLSELSKAGFEFVVIGGMAVGSYAHLRGERVVSADLDIYGSWATLEQILDWAGKHGIVVVKRPQPRSVPTAVLQWDGKEVNILTESAGLPPPEKAAATARVFTLTRRGHVEVLLADPFDLLENKLLVNRPKDRPHVEHLLRFIEEEAVEAFIREKQPRERLAPLRRLLAATRLERIPARLAARLVSLAELPPDFRFLANHVPDAEHAAMLLERARARDEGLSQELVEILARRGLPGTGESSFRP